METLVEDLKHKTDGVWHAFVRYVSHLTFNDSQLEMKQTM